MTSLDKWRGARGQVERGVTKGRGEGVMDGERESWQRGTGGGGRQRRRSLLKGNGYYTFTNNAKRPNKLW